MPRDREGCFTGIRRNVTIFAMDPFGFRRYRNEEKLDAAKQRWVDMQAPLERDVEKFERDADAEFTKAVAFRKRKQDANAKRCMQKRSRLQKAAAVKREHLNKVDAVISVHDNKSFNTDLFDAARESSSILNNTLSEKDIAKFEKAMGSFQISLDNGMDFNETLGEPLHEQEPRETDDDCDEVFDELDAFIGAEIDSVLPMPGGASTTPASVPISAPSNMRVEAPGQSRRNNNDDPPPSAPGTLVDVSLDDEETDPAITELAASLRMLREEAS